MSIYQVKQLVSKIKTSSREELQLMLERIARLNFSKSMQHSINNIVMNEAPADASDAQCYAGPRRVISYKEMKALSQSYLMDHVQRILQAAADPSGPFQSGDLMTVAAMGIEAPWITKDGIAKKDLVQAGYILSMAGFDRKSHFVKEIGQPVKCWILSHSKHLSMLERAISVKTIIKTEIARIEGRDTKPLEVVNTETFGDFI